MRAKIAALERHRISLRQLPHACGSMEREFLDAGTGAGIKHDYPVSARRQQNAISRGGGRSRRSRCRRSEEDQAKATREGVAPRLTAPRWHPNHGDGSRQLDFNLTVNTIS